MGGEGDKAVLRQVLIGQLIIIQGGFVLSSL